jgi:hypothetical protein
VGEPSCSDADAQQILRQAEIDFLLERVGAGEAKRELDGNTVRFEFGTTPTAKVAYTCGCPSGCQAACQVRGTGSSSLICSGKCTGSHCVGCVWDTIDVPEPTPTPLAPTLWHVLWQRALHP